MNYCIDLLFLSFVKYSRSTKDRSTVEGARARDVTGFVLLQNVSHPVLLINVIFYGYFSGLVLLDISEDQSCQC